MSKRSCEAAESVEDAFLRMARVNCNLVIPDTAANLILPCRPVRKIRP